MDEETFKNGCQILWNNVHQLQSGSGESLVSLNGSNWIKSMDDGFDALQVYQRNNSSELIQPYFLFFNEFEQQTMALWRIHGEATAEKIIPIMADKLNALLGHLRIGSNPWPALHTLVRLLERFD